MRFARLAICLTIIFMAFAQKAFCAENIYKTETLKTFDGGEYVLERQTKRKFIISIDIFPTAFSYQQRAQLRSSDGRVVAYTPTRIKAIDYCPDLNNCYIFTWKTAYPFPSIFKFDPGAFQENEFTTPMEYSRNGVPGAGVKGIYSPLFGVFGLLLLTIKTPFYFLGCILFSGTCLGLMALNARVPAGNSMEVNSRNFVRKAAPSDELRRKRLSRLMIRAIIGVMLIIMTGTYHFNIAVYVSSFVLLSAFMLIQIGICQIRGGKKSARLKKLLIKSYLFVLVIWIVIGFAGIVATRSY